MVTDPEWFYSSIAQSAAAIVGLIAAVFGIRFVEDFGRIIGARSNLRPHLLAVRDRINTQVDNLTAYGSAMQKEIDLDKRALEAGQTERASDMSIDWEHGVRPGKMRPENVRSALRAREIYLELWPRVQQVYVKLQGKVSVGDLAAYVARLRGLADEIGPRDGTQPGVVMRDHAAALEDALKEMQQFRAMAYPAHYWLIIALMALIAVPAIIWPLKRLVTSGTQTVMLVLFGGGLAGTILIFALLLLLLRHLRELSWD